MTSRTGTATVFHAAPDRSAALRVGHLDNRTRARSTSRFPRFGLLLIAITCVLVPAMAAAQGLTGAIIGTVKDAQGGVLPGAAVRVSSPAPIGGPETVTTNDKGQLRFPSLPPGSYAFAIELAGFMPYHEVDISIGGGATIERTVVMKVAA
jgi:hypothetical protein